MMGFFILTLSGFILATTVILYQRIYDFIELHDLLYDFGENQVSTAQSMTYLRQINIKLFTNEV